MTSPKFIVKNKVDSTKGKTPTSSDLIDGEIAINNCSGEEKIFIKNSANKIVEFTPKSENINATTLNGTSLSGIRSVGYTMQETVIDATTLNENTWYPVTISLDGSQKTVRIKVSAALNLNNPPSYATHEKGFSVDKMWEVNGNSYGAMTITRTIFVSTYLWAKSDPVRGIGQMTHNSIEYVYVRGGGKYTFSTSHGRVPVLQTSTYTVNGDSVSPTTTEPPLIERTNILKTDTVSKTSVGLCPQLPNETTTTKYLRQDGNWIVPPNTTYSRATSTTLGLVKSSTTGTTANRDYNVEVKTDGTMKVNVPWEDTQDFHIVIDCGYLDERGANEPFENCIYCINNLRTSDSGFSELYNKFVNYFYNDDIAQGINTTLMYCGRIYSQVMYVDDYSDLEFPNAQQVSYYTSPMTDYCIRIVYQDGNVFCSLGPTPFNLYGSAGIRPSYVISDFFVYDLLRNGTTQLTTTCVDITSAFQQLNSYVVINSAYNVPSISQSEAPLKRFQNLTNFFVNGVKRYNRNCSILFKTLTWYLTCIIPASTNKNNVTRLEVNYEAFLALSMTNYAIYYKAQPTIFLTSAFYIIVDVDTSNEVITIGIQKE